MNIPMALAEASDAEGSATSGTSSRVAGEEDMAMTRGEKTTWYHRAKSRRRVLFCRNTIMQNVEFVGSFILFRCLLLGWWG